MIIVLPACSYPTINSALSVSRRELDLISNIQYLNRCGFDYKKMLVVDDGFRRPSVPKDVRLVHDNSLFSESPHVGEALLTQRAVEEVDSPSLILKLHSRCKLLNMNQLQRYIRCNGEFLFLRRNMFRFDRPNFNKCPFAETRLYCLDSLDLKLVIDKVVSIIDDSLYFEHAFLSASYQVHQIRTKLITHASFYPVFSGSSGHGVDYGSFVSRTKSLLHGISYRLGI